MLNDGYRLGLGWIAERPGAFARLALARLEAAWRGAALGWTGHGLPWGVSGTRRAVDLAVPDGPGFAVWRWLLLGGCLVGLWLGRMRAPLRLWLLFAATKLVAVAMFFGYARHGVTVIPVVAALTAVAVGELARRLRLGLPEGRRGLAVATLIACLGLAVEGQRYLRPPTLLLDGRVAGATDPQPLGEHRDRRAEAR